MAAFATSTKHGSARFATEQDLIRAKLIGARRKRGVHLGYFERSRITLNADAPITLIAGSGSGKGRDILLYTSLYPDPVLFNDPRGEIAAVTIHYQINHGKACYCINPLGLHAQPPWFLPMHGVNPLDILKPSSPSLVADIKLILEMLIVSDGRGGDDFFIGRARNWGGALLLWLVLKNGQATLPAFYALVNRIEGSALEWARIAGDMATFPNEEIRATAGEMLFKREQASGEYSGIMGVLMKGLNFLSDPSLSACLSRADFSLEALCSRVIPCNVYLIVPADYVGVWASFLRVIIGVAMLYKTRHPEAPRVLFQLDEAAQLGRFEALLRAYTYGRGAGIRTLGVFQDLNQMRTYGHGAEQTFLGSSQVRQFFGVRDFETASLVSKMCGTATYAYHDHRAQAQSRHARDQARYAAMTGQMDYIQAAYDYRFHDRESCRPSEMPRLLMTPDEVMNMDDNRQILFISGVNCPPIFGHKYPYYLRRCMAGAFQPNPNHPPYDVLTVCGRKRRIISKKVPSALSHWPQYQLGYWSYVQGYKPRLPFLLSRTSRKLKTQQKSLSQQRKQLEVLS